MARLLLYAGILALLAAASTVASERESFSGEIEEASSNKEGPTVRKGDPDNALLDAYDDAELSPSSLVELVERHASTEEENDDDDYDTTTNVFCRNRQQRRSSSHDDDQWKATELRLYVHQPLPARSVLNHVYLSEILPALESAVLSVSIGPPHYNTPVDVFIYHPAAFRNNSSSSEAMIDYHLYYKTRFANLDEAYNTIQMRKFSHIPGSNVYWIMAWMVPSRLPESTQFNCAFYVFDSNLMVGHKTPDTRDKTSLELKTILYRLRGRYWNPILEQIDDLQVSRHLWLNLKDYEMGSISNAYRNLYFDSGIGKNSDCINAYFHHVLNKEFLSHLRDNDMLSVHGYSTTYGWFYTRSLFTGVPERGTTDGVFHYTTDNDRASVSPLTVLNKAPNDDHHSMSDVVYWDDIMPTFRASFVRPTLHFNQSIQRKTAKSEVLHVNTTIDKLSLSGYTAPLEYLVHTSNPVIGVADSRSNLCDRLESAIQLKIVSTNTNWVYSVVGPPRDFLANLTLDENEVSIRRETNDFYGFSLTNSFDRVRVTGPNGAIHFRQIDRHILETKRCDYEALKNPVSTGGYEAPPSTRNGLLLSPSATGIGEETKKYRRPKRSATMVMLAIDIGLQLLTWVIGMATDSSSSGGGNDDDYVVNSLDEIMLRQDEQIMYSKQILRELGEYYDLLDSRLNIIQSDVSRVLDGAAVSGGERLSSFPRYDGMFKNCSSGRDDDAAADAFSPRYRRSLSRTSVKLGFKSMWKSAKTLPRRGWKGARKVVSRKTLRRPSRTLRQSRVAPTKLQKWKNGLVVGIGTGGAVVTIGVGGKIIKGAGKWLSRNMPKNETDRSVLDDIRYELGDGFQKIGGIAEAPLNLAGSAASAVNKAADVINTIDELSSYWIIVVIVFAVLLFTPCLGAALRLIYGNWKTMSSIVKTAGSGLQRMWAPLRAGKNGVLKCNACRKPLLELKSKTNFTPVDFNINCAVMYSPGQTPNFITGPVLKTVEVNKNNIHNLDYGSVLDRVQMPGDAKWYLCCKGCNKTLDNQTYRGIIGYVLDETVTLYLNLSTIE